MLRTIKGDWLEDGFLQGRERLVVEMVNGRMTDPIYGDEFYLEDRGVGCCAVIRSVVGAWEFAPDESEIVRLGLKAEPRRAEIDYSTLSH